MKTPKNKQEVLNVSKRSNEHWEYDRNLLNMLYKFLVDIGANKDLPDDKTQLKGYLVRLHETITIKNSMFPLYTDFLELYQAWMNDVIFGKIGRNGNNISALARCFNEWYKANANNWIKKEHKEEQVERTSGREENQLKPCFGCQYCGLHHRCGDPHYDARTHCITTIRYYCTCLRLTLSQKDLLCANPFALFYLLVLPLCFTVAGRSMPIWNKHRLLWHCGELH